ncbi:unnamed protein product [Caenorhabditis auriculariae]|uniref:ShKT domain-containing protein n=1 Tax=Caenorhabditis auriculariae TaxID=2777116 RepID=A0A8S1HGQ4_9PELO|nr:unnamed protein product [Caenorhabditis auriculariae]
MESRRFSAAIVCIMTVLAGAKECSNNLQVPCMLLQRFCSASGYVAFMNEHCAFTCGLCKACEGIDPSK